MGVKDGAPLSLCNTSYTESKRENKKKGDFFYGAASLFVLPFPMGLSRYNRIRTVSRAATLAAG
jgi:hypothetical protein